MEQITLMDVPANTLPELFTLQRALLDKYILIEGLPSYKELIMPLSEKSHQNLLRDFMFRTLEELGEAYEELYQANKCIQTNQVGEARAFIARYNEEVADSFHFWLELLLYSGIDEWVISSKVEDMLRNNVLEVPVANVPNRPLKSLYLLGSFLNTQQLPRISPPTMFTIYTDREAAENPYIAGGRKLNEALVSVHCTFLWEITHTLLKAANTLKNKNWKQSDEARQVNTMQYTTYIMDAFSLYIQYLDFTEITEIPLYHSYTRKNNLNHERIAKKY